MTILVIVQKTLQILKIHEFPQYCGTAMTSPALCQRHCVMHKRGGGFFKGWPSLKFHHGGPARENTGLGPQGKSFIMVGPNEKKIYHRGPSRQKLYHGVPPKVLGPEKKVLSWWSPWENFHHGGPSREKDGLGCGIAKWRRGKHLKLSLHLHLQLLHLAYLSIYPTTHVICLCSQVRRAKHPKLCKFTSVWLSGPRKWCNSMDYWGRQPCYFLSSFVTWLN